MTAAPSDNAEPSFFGRGVRPGEVIAARYRVVGELGAGGMGQVLEVEHVELDKRFALKLVRPDRWDAALDQRFRREARALARVTSPRVAQITDFGVDPDRGPFYVMERVEGVALDTLIQREGPLSHQRGLELAIGIAQALVDVHEAGIVHRDVKPGNIGVCTRGPVEVRLLDFGLAASVDDRLGSRLTETKRVVGSMPYMAPEQFHGESPSPQMDLWALGIVLYEMWTAKLPFDAASAAALIHQILTATPPAMDSIPHEGAVVLDRLLAKDRGARVQSAREAVSVLERALEMPIGTLGPRPPSIATAEATRVELGASSPPSSVPPTSMMARSVPPSSRPPSSVAPSSVAPPASIPSPVTPSPTIPMVLGVALGMVGLLALVGAGAWIAGRSAPRADAIEARADTSDRAPEEARGVAAPAEPRAIVEAAPSVRATGDVESATQARATAETEPTASDATDGARAPSEARPTATARAVRDRAGSRAPAEGRAAPSARAEPAASDVRTEPAAPSREPATEEPWNGGIIESTATAP